MGLFDFFKTKQKNTAQDAKQRLLIIVQQERTARESPDYLPLLRKELLEVIRKYVNVDPDAVQVELEKDGSQEMLSLSVALPERK